MLMKEEEYKGTFIQQKMQRYLHFRQYLFKWQADIVKADASLSNLAEKQNMAFEKRDNYIKKYNSWEHRIARMMGSDEIYKKLENDCFQTSSNLSYAQHIRRYQANDQNWMLARKVVNSYPKEFSNNHEFKAFLEDCKKHYPNINSIEDLNNWVLNSQNNAIAFQNEVRSPMYEASNNVPSKTDPEVNIQLQPIVQSESDSRTQELYELLQEQNPSNNPRYQALVTEISSLSSQDRERFIKNLLHGTGTDSKERMTEFKSNLLPKYNQFYNDVSQQLSNKLHYKSAETQDIDLIAKKSKENAAWEEPKLHMHLFTVKAAETMSKTYKKMKGDALKTAILSDFKLALESQPKENIEEYVREYKKSDEYKILKANQDLIGLVGKVFGHKTASIEAFDAIVEEVRANASAHKPENQ